MLTPPSGVSLKSIAENLLSATESEDWEAANALLRQLVIASSNTLFAQQDRSELKETINQLNQAIGATVRRRDEIKGLLNNLGVET